VYGGLAKYTFGDERREVYGMIRRQRCRRGSRSKVYGGLAKDTFGDERREVQALAPEPEVSPKGERRSMASPSRRRGLAMNRGAGGGSRSKVYGGLAKDTFGDERREFRRSRLTLK